MTAEPRPTRRLDFRLAPGSEEFVEPRECCFADRRQLGDELWQCHTPHAGAEHVRVVGVASVRAGRVVRAADLDFSDGPVGRETRRTRDE